MDDDDDEEGHEVDIPTLYQPYDDGKEGYEVDICTNNAEDHDENYDGDRHEHVDTGATVCEAVPTICFYF